MIQISKSQTSPTSDTSKSKSSKLMTSLKVRKNAAKSKDPSIGKRKKVCLSFADKKKVLEKIAEGYSIDSLAKVYNISRRSVYQIRANAPDTYRYLHPEDSLKKTNKTTDFPELEEALRNWFIQSTSDGTVPTWVRTQSQAMKIYADLYPDKETRKPFNASKGYVQRFCSRNSLQMNGQRGGKKTVDNKVDTVAFQNDFEKDEMDCKLNCFDNEIVSDLSFENNQMYDRLSTANCGASDSWTNIESVDLGGEMVEGTVSPIIVSEAKMVLASEALEGISKFMIWLEEQDVEDKGTKLMACGELKKFAEAGVKKQLETFNESKN